MQQVSPSTSAPGALSVLTDSFSLAGMLTERQKAAEAEVTSAGRMKKRRDKDELSKDKNVLHFTHTVLFQLLSCWL